MSGYGVSVQEKDPTKLAAAIQSLYAGRTNASGICTLTPGATSTVVNAPNCAAGNAVFLFPASLDAAAALASTFIASGNVGMKQFTITHANAASADRTFFFVCLG